MFSAFLGFRTLSRSPHLNGLILRVVRCRVLSLCHRPPRRRPLRCQPARFCSLCCFIFPWLLMCGGFRRRHSENERSLKSNLSLCNETLHMVTYLTSDPDIQKPFLREELLLRLAEMLLCVLKQLVSIAVRCSRQQSRFCGGSGYGTLQWPRQVFCRDAARVCCFAVWTRRNAGTRRAGALLFSPRGKSDLIGEKYR